MSLDSCKQIGSTWFLLNLPEPFLESILYVENLSPDGSS